MLRAFAAAVLLVTGCATTLGLQPQAGTARPQALTGAAFRTPDFEVPIEQHTLDNGLRVVLSRDTTAPTAIVAVYYHVGFRLEPRGQTGFAHLFEHMMFQGSRNLGKLEFTRLVQSNGGLLNGSTNFDFTNYFQAIPAHALEPVLWAEADRMASLAITPENLRNQQDVVKNEVRVNVLNQPYGGFPWLDLPQRANENWYNAHNFYGDFADLEAARPEDFERFFETYYSPANAVLVVVGDLDPEATLGWIETYFGDIPAGPLPRLPDLSEPRQEEEKRFVKPDSLATRPALAVGYHAPPRGAREYLAMGLLDHILLQGKDSRLYQALVQRRGLTGEVQGGFLLEGNMFNVEGPTLWHAYLFHDAETHPDTILAAIDTEVERLRSELVDAETLERARTKMRAQLYGLIELFFGFGRAEMLACLTLFDNDATRLNRLEDEFEAITPELLQATAREYLRRTNRTVLLVEPRPRAGAPEAEGEQ